MVGRAARSVRGSVRAWALVLCAVATPAVATGCADDPPDVRVGSQTASDGEPEPVEQDAGGVAAAPADAGGGAAIDDWNGVTVTVQALDNTFRPADLVIEAGTEVVFDNVGRNEHDVVPEPGSIQGWGVGEDRFAPGDRYAHVFTEPGEYLYLCTIHGVNRKGMVGTITVTAASGA